MSAKMSAREFIGEYRHHPPGGVAYAHIHVDFRSDSYIIEGRVRHEFGAGLKHVIENRAGDFITSTRRSSRSLQHGKSEPRGGLCCALIRRRVGHIIPYNRTSGRLNFRHWAFDVER